MDLGADLEPDGWYIGQEKKTERQQIHKHARTSVNMCSLHNSQKCFLSLDLWRQTWLTITSQLETNQWCCTVIQILKQSGFCHTLEFLNEVLYLIKQLNLLQSVVSA